MNFEELRNRTIGTVEYVSSREIKVLLETNAPQSTALNTGTPQLFPKINGYVLIPNENGALIGIISWIGIEYSNYPKRKGYKDFDLVDLPFPTRKLSVSPVGVLKTKESDNNIEYYVERGVFSYPSVGDTVVIPSNNQLKAIIENKDDNAKIKIGTSPLAANGDVFVNPDKLFGRHLAVLGNTGSGKSCSVAGLIRWSIEAAKKETEKLNCRFLILDPNDEYESCFNDLGNVRKFKVIIDNDKTNDVTQLKVPSWMWNSYEWSAVTRASDKSQRPLLRKALKEIRYGELHSSIDDRARIFFQYLYIEMVNLEYTGSMELGKWPGKDNFGELLESCSKSIETLISEQPIKFMEALNQVNIVINNILSTHPKSGKYYPPFSLNDIKLIRNKIDEYQSIIGELEIYKGPDADTPLFFDNEKFVNYLEQLIRENSSVTYMDFFMMRIRTLTQSPL